MGSGADIVSPSSLALSTKVYRKSYVHVRDIGLGASRWKLTHPSAWSSILIWWVEGLGLATIKDRQKCLRALERYDQRAHTAAAYSETPVHAGRYFAVWGSPTLGS